MSRLCKFFLLASVVLIQVGCSGSSNVPTANDVDSNGNQVSSVPWNKPESWETSGQLGAMGGQ